MPIYTDQTGRCIDIPAEPRRIISLVPSQTEYLFDLGLTDEVIGITKFCVHPDAWFRNKTRIGGTKDLHIDQILSLKPDLVIANKEENTAEQVLSIAEKVPVWTSDITNLDGALHMMISLGQITGKEEKAQHLSSSILHAFAGLSAPNVRSPATAYLIWEDPYMTVGGDTFIHDMLTRCGLHNIFGASTRYPETSIALLKAAGVDLLLLSSEPYPFKQKHLDALQSALPTTQILLVNGEYFSWYGSRLAGAPKYFTGFLKNLDSRM